MIMDILWKIIICKVCTSIGKKHTSKRLLDQLLSTNSILILSYYLINSNTISWSPYIVIDKCDSEGKNCGIHQGFYYDFTNILGKILNFTWEGHTDTDGNWGLLPIKIEEGSNKTTRKGGPEENVSEEGLVWGGVMGSIVNGDYMMSTVTWIWVYERYGLVDFISTSWQNTLLALTPKPLVGYTYIQYKYMDSFTSVFQIPFSHNQIPIYVGI